MLNRENILFDSLKKSVNTYWSFHNLWEFINFRIYKSHIIQDIGEDLGKIFFHFIIDHFHVEHSVKHVFLIFSFFIFPFIIFHCLSSKSRNKLKNGLNLRRINLTDVQKHMRSDDFEVGPLEQCGVSH